jgi:hypothetical protein
MRYIAERPDHLGMAEIADSRATCAAERDDRRGPSLRDNARPRITAAIGLQHSVGSLAMPSSPAMKSGAPK